MVTTFTFSGRHRQPSRLYNSLGVSEWMGLKYNKDFIPNHVGTMIVHQRELPVNLSPSWYNEAIKMKSSRQWSSTFIQRAKTSNTIGRWYKCNPHNYPCLNNEGYSCSKFCSWVYSCRSSYRSFKASYYHDWNIVGKMGLRGTAQQFINRVTGT